MARGGLVGRGVIQRNMHRKTDPSAAALFKRFTTPPTSARKKLINTAIVALKKKGLWTKLDVLYMAGADAQATQRNWRGDIFNLTEAGTVSHVADRGYTGNGVDGHLITGFNPTASPGQYTLNSASAGVYNRTAAALDNVSKADMGVPTGGLIRVSPRVTGNLFTVRGNRAVNLNLANADGVGFYHFSRVAAAGYRSFKNGALMADGAAAPSTGIPADVIVLLRDAALYSNHQIAAAFVGGGLTAPEGVDLYNIILAYLQGIGAA